MRGKRTSSWGTGIAVSFGVFVVAVLAMVYLSVSQRVDLVSDRYYDEGLRYQDRMKARSRAADLGEVNVSAVRGGIVVRFPSSIRPADVSGNLTLYRPDDRREDTAIPVVLDSTGTQTVRTERLARGLWRVQVQWQMLGVDYYNEQAVVLQ